jgi:hypothetical protein
MPSTRESGILTLAAIRKGKGNTIPVQRKTDDFKSWSGRKNGSRDSDASAGRAAEEVAGIGAD